MSEAGVGSTFWFEIPTTEANENDLNLPNLDGLTILSVEDHPRGAKEIESSLNSMGAKVTSVNNCAEALNLVAHTPFDVVVVDNGLPDGDGVHLLRELNRMRPFMGLILYTVYDDYAVQQICKSIGATYLSKPASRLGLGETVKAAAKQTSKTNFDKPKRLLICEDTESVRDILRRQLKVIGVEADFAENGQIGWDIIQRGEHGLIISDLHMPEMDGYGLINAVREHDEKTNTRLPVVVMTADVQLANQQAYLKYGFDECLLKPVSLGQIRQLFMRWGLLQEVAEPAKPEPEQPSEKPTELSQEVVTTPMSNDITPLPIDGKPIIDPVMAIDQLGAFDADALDMVQMFVNMTRPQIADIKQAFADMDWLKLKLAAHSLKGGARSACCPRLGDVAEKLQHNSERQAVDGNLVHETLQEFEFVERHLAELMSKG
jgi:CheY-like chemotaxis protein